VLDAVVSLWMINNFVNCSIISDTPGKATGGFERRLRDALAGICSNWRVEILKST